jgi:hypothetical protein
MIVPFPSVWHWQGASGGARSHRADLKHVVQELQA